MAKLFSRIRDSYNALKSRKGKRSKEINNRW